MQVLQRQKSEREAKKRAVQLMKMEMEQSPSSQPRNVPVISQELPSSVRSAQTRNVPLTYQEPLVSTLANHVSMKSVPVTNPDPSHQQYSTNEHPISQYSTAQLTNHNGQNGSVIMSTSYSGTNGSSGGGVNGEAGVGRGTKGEWEEEEDRERERTRQAAIRVQEEQRSLMGRMRGTRRPDAG